VPRPKKGAALILLVNISSRDPQITICPHFVRFRGKIYGYSPARNRFVLGTFEMKMSVRAGAFAVATLALLLNASLAQAGEYTAVNAEQGQPPASIDIARIKSVLKLTSSQEPYWAPVEAALRDLARQQTHAAEADGLVHRISHKVVSVVLNSAAVHRLAVAARPLIAKLDEDQMRAAHGLAAEMGLGPVVAALR
jgi:hypothetical protein